MPSSPVLSDFDPVVTWGLGYLEDSVTDGFCGP